MVEDEETPCEAQTVGFAEQSTLTSGTFASGMANDHVVSRCSVFLLCPCLSAIGLTSKD